MSSVNGTDFWGLLAWGLWCAAALVTLLWAYMAAFMKTDERWINEQKVLEAFLLALVVYDTWTQFSKWHILWCFPLILIALRPIVFAVRFRLAAWTLHQTITQQMKGRTETQASGGNGAGALAGPAAAQRDTHLCLRRARCPNSLCGATMTLPLPVPKELICPKCQCKFEMLNASANSQREPRTTHGSGWAKATRVVCPIVSCGALIPVVGRVGDTATCPACGARLVVSKANLVEEIGRSARCPNSKCSAVLVVPDGFEGLAECERCGTKFDASAAQPVGD